METKFSQQQAEQIIALAARAEVQSPSEVTQFQEIEENDSFSEEELFQLAEEAGISQFHIEKAISEVLLDEKIKEETKLNEQMLHWFISIALGCAITGILVGAIHIGGLYRLLPDKLQPATSIVTIIFWEVIAIGFGIQSFRLSANINGIRDEIKSGGDRHD